MTHNSPKPSMRFFYHLADQSGLVERGADRGILRAACINCGLSAAGWRFLVRHGDAAFSAAIDPERSVTQTWTVALSYLEWQARAGLCQPFPESLGEVLLAIAVGEMDLQKDFVFDPRIGRAALDYWSSRKDEQAREYFISEEWPEVLIWIRYNSPTFDRNQWRAGWRAILRQYRQYRHGEILKQPQVQWDSFVGGFNTASWQITPLTNSRELVREGMSMRHCVSSYSRRCVDGEWRLFSICNQASGKPQATVGLIKRNNHWELGQVRGKYNRDPDPEIRKLAKHILKRYRKEEKEAWLRLKRKECAAVSQPRLMVSRFRGNSMVLRDTGTHGWQKAGLESSSLPRRAMEVVERYRAGLNSIPPNYLPDEEDWQALDDRIHDLCSELRAQLPAQFRIFREDAEVDQLVEVW